MIYVPFVALYRTKHPVKLHVWAGISMRERTGICIFDGTMDANSYVNILRHTLLPFLHDVYPDGHRFMQDNDPKHTSPLAAQFFEDRDINWWRTPSESPDLNPIENFWHKMKDFVRRKVKPHSKDELINGIHQFWQSVTVEKCSRYIRHLWKVFPSVIQEQGGPTGY